MPMNRIDVLVEDYELIQLNWIIVELARLCIEVAQAKMGYDELVHLG